MANKFFKLFTILGIIWFVKHIIYIFRRRVSIDRILVQGKFKSIVILFLMVYLLLIVTTGIFHLFGVTGSTLFNETSSNINTGLLWTVLYHFVDPGNQHMAEPGFARIIVFVLSISGCIILNGILVSAIIGWYERFVDKWRTGLARYDKLLQKCNFVVIIGANEMVFNLIKQILSKKEDVDYIVLQTNQDVEILRKQLCSFLTPNEEKRVIIYFGERTSQDDINELHIDYAKKIFVFGESLKRGCYETNSEQNHDALNMKCLQLITTFMNDCRHKSSQKLECNVLFEYQTTYSIFQFADISSNIEDFIDFRPINYYEMWAQRVLVNRNLDFNKIIKEQGYLPLEGTQAINYECDDFVHIVIIGMSKMGIAMAIEAAHVAHYPNHERNKQCKTRITFIDKDCETEMQYFQSRFRNMFEMAAWRFVESKGNLNIYEQSNNKQKGDWQNVEKFNKNHYLGEEFIDIEWEFIRGGIESMEIHRYLEEASLNKYARLTIAICLPQDNQSIAASLYLPENVYEKSVQILIYQRQNDSTINSIAKDNKKNLYYKRLKAFGMLEKAYDLKLLDDIHNIALELGKKYGIMYNSIKEKEGFKTISRNTIRGKSRAAKQWSNIYNANTLWTKLRSVGSLDGSIEEKDIEVLSRTEHNRWVVEQLLMRFRALTEEEQNLVIEGNLDKEVLKGDKMAHLDICSFDRLQIIDKAVIKNDRGFIEIIPNLYRSIDARL